MAAEIADLEHVRFIDVADVYKAGVLAATLRRTRGGVVFEYTSEHLAAGRRPVATTLPLSPDPLTTPAGAVPPFFAGLLPEGRRLIALRSAVKTSADDELSLLIAVGADTVGDVQVVAHGAPPSRPAPRVDVADWSQVRFVDLVREDAAHLDLAALPGVQTKVSAATIAVPAAGLFILKLDPPEYPHVVANEAFFLKAAAVSGLTAAEGEVVVDAEGRHGLLVRRFDRVVDGDAVTPRAQEDACQALGRYPADKYNLTAETVLGGLVRLARARPVAGRDLVAQVAFAYLTGNGDQHAKNLSMAQASSGEWRVTPAYDTPTTYVYGDTTMALSIDGRRREDITRASFLRLGASVGVPERAVAKVLDRLCDRVDGWIDGVGELPFDDRRLHKLARLIQDRRAKLSGVAGPRAGGAFGQLG